jgi:hypothetical protein
MKRNSPKRREAKRQQLVEELNWILVSACYLEHNVMKLAEALIFILEAQCPKKQ